LKTLEKFLPSAACQWDYNNIVMRRLLSLTALGLASLLPLTLHAQRGMGGRGFGGGSGRASSGFRSSAPAGPRGFSGGMRGFSGSPRGFSGGPRGFAPAPGGFNSRPFAPGSRRFAPARSNVAFHTFSPGRRTFFPGRTAGFNRFHHRFHNGFFFRDRFFTRGCFGCFSPFFFDSGFFLGAPYYSGFSPDYYGYDYGYGYGAPPPPQPVVVNSDNGANVELATQVQHLSDEIEDLRNEERRESRPAANSGGSISAREPAATTTFVFRDGRRISTQNYALAGQTLWIFTEHTAHKYSLTELDAAATEQANAANGVDFHLPAQH
jgi:hypothetical protein